MVEALLTAILSDVNTFFHLGFYSEFVQKKPSKRVRAAVITGKETYILRAQKVTLGREEKTIQKNHKRHPSIQKQAIHWATRNIPLT